MGLPTPEELKQMGIDVSKIKTVPASTITASVEKPERKFSSGYKEDYEKASKDFWSKNPLYLTSYMTGSIAGGYSKKDKTLNCFFDNIFTYIKEVIRFEFSKKKLTTENLKNNFDSLNISLKILHDALKQIDGNIDVKSVYAFLQGSINSYISNNFSESNDGETKKE